MVSSATQLERTRDELEAEQEALERRIFALDSTGQADGVERAALVRRREQISADIEFVLQQLDAFANQAQSQRLPPRRRP